MLLRPEVGAPFFLPVEQFHHLQASGLIAQASFSTPSPLSEVARARIAKASPKSQEAGNFRWQQMLEYCTPAKFTFTLPPETGDSTDAAIEVQEFTLF